MSQTNQTPTAISATITNATYGVPMTHHVPVRIEHDLANGDSIVTFASYFSQQAHSMGMQALSHTSVVINETDAIDLAPVLTAVVNDDSEGNVFKGGELV